MNELYRCITLFLLGSLAACTADRPSDDRHADDRPNVIYIMADDLGYGDIGVYGQKKIRTPNIDALAQDGIIFSQHYAGSTVCAPSRAALMTGRHTGNSNIRGNLDLGGYRDEEERGQMPLRRGAETLATVMKRAGYQTAAIGKWGMGGPGSDGVPTKQGFDYFFGYLDQKQAHNYYPSHLWENEVRFPLDNDFFIPHAGLNKTSAKPEDYKIYQGRDYAPDRLLAKAKAYIRSNKDKPFFLYLAFVVPHAALQLPDDRLPDYAKDWPDPPLKNVIYTPHPRPRAVMAGMISNMDAGVGEIRKILVELGLDKNTLIIFTSDNGPSAEGGADLDFFNSNGPLRGGKRDLYEGGIREPMIAHWPGKIKAGSTTDHISAFWDVMPTLADIADIQLSQETDGLSFLPSLLGQKEKQTDHDYLYWEFPVKWRGYDGAQAVRMGKWKAVRIGGRSTSRAPIELYDLSQDISEQRDLAAQYPDVIVRMKKKMNQRSEAPVKDWNFTQAQ